MQPSPMCWNMLMTLLAHPPPDNIAKDRSKFPAGMYVPGIAGWLFHTLSRWMQFSLLHVVSTCTIIKNPLISTNTPGILQVGQTSNNCNRSGRKTTNFGCVSDVDHQHILWKIDLCFVVITLVFATSNRKCIAYTRFNCWCAIFSRTFDLTCT